MNVITCRLDARFQRPRGLVIVVGMLATALLGATAGCQRRTETLSGPARILFDSLVAAHEAMHDSAGPNLGYDRWHCLLARGSDQLGSDIAERISEEATASVDSRHSTKEWKEVNQRLLGAHPMPSPESCRSTDSLWYVRGVGNDGSRP